MYRVNVRQFRSLILRFSRKQDYTSKPSIEATAISESNNENSAQISEHKIPFAGKTVLPKRSLTKTGSEIKLEPIDPFAQSELMTKITPFDQVPGPTVLKKLSTFWSYLPIVSNQVAASSIKYLLSAGSQLSWSNNLWLFRHLLDEYGPIVRLNGPLGGDVVIISRPEHANAIFENEGRFPIRFNLDSLEKYRTEYRKFKQARPFLMFGSEWEELRKEVEMPLQQCVSAQFDKIASTCDQFVNRILLLRNHQEEVPANFLSEIHKWSIQCLCTVMINRPINLLDPNSLDFTTEQTKFLNALNAATEAIRKCESLQLWKFIETPTWKKLTNNCDMLEMLLGKYIQGAQASLQTKKSSPQLQANEDMSLVEHLLLKENMIAEDILTVFLDMLLIGMNMISHTVCFLLYHLSRFPRTQRLLYLELKDTPENISKEELLSLPYLQACIKESLRLKPPMPVISRELAKDITINHYRIPKGTYVLMATYLSNLREEYFEDALKFKPERWLQSETADGEYVTSSIPFEYGPKACLGKEMAELQISLLLSKMIRRYWIEYHYGDINSKYQLLSSPDRPLKFRFLER